MTSQGVGAAPGAGRGRAPAAGLRPTLDVERRLWRDGHRWVAGLDEVGRGAWAGPVSVGVAVLATGCRSRTMPAWLRDSKALPEDRREAVFGQVAAWCADGAVGHASAAECDALGMTAALRLAAYRALAALELVPDAVVIDGPFDYLRPPEGMAAPPRLPATVVPVVDGDARCAGVAAASILAKVVRDRLMRADADHYPAYCFERNKGYPSPAHKFALRGYGLSAIHRRSWAFVSDLPFGSPDFNRRPASPTPAADPTPPATGPTPPATGPTPPAAEPTPPAAEPTPPATEPTPPAAAPDPTSGMLPEPADDASVPALLPS